MAQLGETLKQAREAQSITLDDVERDTHIQRQYLEALENNDFKTFASPVMARGMIRNYAKYLNLDPIEALTLYDGNGVVPVKGQRLTPNGIEFMDLGMAPRPMINWELLFGVFLFLAVLGAGAYLFYGNFAQPSVTATATKTPMAEGLTDESALLLPTVTPLPTNSPTPPLPTDTPTPTIYAGVTVELVVNQPSWVQILSDDIKVFEGILQPGETNSWSGQQRVAIRAGNGGGVEVFVNGTSRGLMGAEGQVVDQIWEKVDDGQAPPPQPTALLEPEETPTLDILNEPPPTPFPTPEEGAENQTDGEQPLPLEDAPPTPENQ